MHFSALFISSICQPLIGWRSNWSRRGRDKKGRSNRMPYRRRHRRATVLYLLIPFPLPASSFDPSILPAIEPIIIRQGMRGRELISPRTQSAASPMSQNKLNPPFFVCRVLGVEIHYHRRRNPLLLFLPSCPRFAIALSLAHARCHLITISLFELRLHVYRHGGKAWQGRKG